MSIVKSSWISLHRFFTFPLPPASLGIFRILIASFTILQAFLWYPDWLSFFGPDALVQWEISNALVPEMSIHISRLYQLFAFSGISETQFVIIFFWIYVFVALGLLIGWHTRSFAILTWFWHYVIMCSIDIYVYGVDIFLQIALFYFMFMPINKALSLDAFRKSVNKNPSWTVTLSMRVFQIHLCLIYLSSGYEKMLSPGWWNGNTLWRSLVQPDFNQFSFEWLANYPWIVITLSCFTMFIEAGYCIAMWIPRMRVFWLAAIILLHSGIAVFLGLWLFGLIMILLSVSAFGYDALLDIRHWYKKRKLRRTNSMQFQTIDGAHPIIMG